jgi:hypothetical protein
MFWKAIQLTVFFSLTISLHELAPETTMLAAMVLALGCTVLIFAPLLHVQLWMAAHRNKAR